MKPFYLLIVGLCFHISSWCQDAPLNEHETKIEKILKNKNDVDFEFYMGGGRTETF